MGAFLFIHIFAPPKAKLLQIELKEMIRFNLINKIQCDTRKNLKTQSAAPLTRQIWPVTSMLVTDVGDKMCW